MSEASPTEILEEVHRLGSEDRRRVLEYARSLGRLPAKGTSAQTLLAHAGVISESDAFEIAEAIEEGCERIDRDGW